MRTLFDAYHEDFAFNPGHIWVSGEMISILVAPEVVASIACNNSFASSWLLSRYATSLWLALHWLPITSFSTVTSLL